MRSTSSRIEVLVPYDRAQQIVGKIHGSIVGRVAQRLWVQFAIAVKATVTVATTVHGLLKGPEWPLS